MPNPMTLKRMWRILKEIDLEAIRREATSPLQVHIIGETNADADQAAVLLAAGQAPAARYFTAMDADLAVGAGTDRQAAVVDGPELVILVTRGREVSPLLDRARQLWLDRRVPIVTLALDSGDPVGLVQAGPRGTRVALAGLVGTAAGRVADAAFSAVRPERRAALARQFPGLRPSYVDDLIAETAKANAGYAFSTGLAEIVPVLDLPLNIGDIVVLTKNQLVMGYRIALASGKDGKPKELIGEIVGVLGGGLLFRQAARQLIGLVPVIGIVPKVAIAYGGTWAIGRALALWATEGRRVTRKRLAQLSAEGLDRGRAVARALKRGDR